MVFIECTNALHERWADDFSGELWQPLGMAAKKKAATPARVASLAKKGQALASQNARKGADAIALIGRRWGTIVEAFYDIGLALIVLQKPAVYGALGAKSFAELVETRTPISRALAFELVKIPLHLSRESALALGREKSSAVIRYIEATSKEDSAESVARGDERIGGKSAHELSAVKIESAARKARPQKSGKNAVDRAAVAVAAELKKRLVKGERGLDVDVEAASGSKIRIVVPVELASRIVKRARAK